MKSSVKPFLFLIFILIFSLSSFSFVKLTSRINKSEIKFDENFTYTLRFEGLQSPIQQPPLPDIDGANVKGQYQTVEPHKDGFAYLYHYIISPSRAGTIRMPNFTIKVEKQILKAEGFEVKVTEGTKPISLPEPELTKSNVKPEIFLEGRLSKGECYEGEALIYSLHLLTRESVRNFEFIEKPDFDGFRKIELPSSSYPKTSKIEKNGKLFLDAVVFKAVLFALKKGSIPISHFTADAKVQFSQGTVQLVRIKGGETKVSVFSLPNPPKGFKGCIGNFKARISPQNFIHSKVNEISSFEVEIEGEGSLPVEPFDIPQSPFFENYPPKISDYSEEKDNKFISKKKIVLSFTPLVEGKRTLPDINIIFFDTRNKKYENLLLKVPTIDVESGAIEKGEKKVEILPPLSEPDNFQREKNLILSQSLMFLSLPFLLTIVIFIFWSFLEKLILSPEKIRVRSLEQKAFRELKKAMNNIDARKSKEFHSHLRKSLEAFIEIVINEGTTSLTLQEIEEKLKKSALDKETSETIISLLNEIDSAQFSLEMPQKTTLKKRALKAKSILKKKKIDPKLISLFLLGFFVIFSYAEDSTGLLFKKGYEEQSRGNLEEAIKYYKMVEDHGKAYPALYYNIANCYFESGRIPYAILYYKKALKLKPSFIQAQTNLSISQNLLKSKISPYELSPFDKLLISANEKFIFYIALILVTMGNLIFSLLKLFGFLNRKVFLTRFSIILMVLGLFASFVFYKSISVKTEFREAVVLENSEVYEKPDPSLKSNVSLPEGSVVYLSELSAVWAKIKWGEGEGYVYCSKLGVP